MKRYALRFEAGRHGGFTLIELMVSITIGLLVSVSLIATYLGSSASAKVAEAQMRMNEDAQAALIILAQQLRMAGSNPPQAGRTEKSRFNPVYQPYPSGSASYSTDPASYSLSAFAIRGCDGTFTNLPTAVGLDDLQCASGTNALPDSIAVSYEADPFNTVPTTGGLPADCIGVALKPIVATFSAESTPGPYTYYVADSRFYIGPSGSMSTPTLFCKGGIDSTAQPLVENIENLQFRYGAVALAALPGDVRSANVAGYLSANETTGLTGIPNDAVPWQKVVAVQVCVLVRSEGQVLSDSVAASYIDCEGTPATAPDHRLRRAFYATVVLRNRRT